MTGLALLRSFDHPRRLIWLPLAAIVTVAWAALILAMPEISDFWQSLCGQSMVPAAYHVAMWVAMVFAMMLPTAAPMIATYVDIAEVARGKSIAVVTPLVLATGYMVVWLSFALLAGSLQAVTDPSGIPGISGAIMILAGAWQFAPLKHACLEKCRHPMPYFLANWSERRSAVLRMGVTQGLNCLGCCFAMMGLMFIAGAMNIVWMAVLAVLMIVEKTASRPKPITHTIGSVLVLAGAMRLAVELLS